MRSCSQLNRHLNIFREWFFSVKNIIIYREGSIENVNNLKSHTYKMQHWGQWKLYNKNILEKIKISISCKMSEIYMAKKLINLCQNKYSSHYFCFFLLIMSVSVMFYHNTVLSAFIGIHLNFKNYILKIILNKNKGPAV